MDNQRPGPYQPVSLVSVETTITGNNAQKKRKSGGLLSSLKFWKRNRKAKSLPPISRPTEFQHVSGTSNRLVGATAEERYQKAVSLPQSVTRDSALGSHAPFENVVLEKQVESDVEVDAPRKALQRRATLPRLTTPHQHSSQPDKRQSILDNGQILDPSDIGFAVTSGANFLKRRSRSLGALYSAAAAQQEEPTLTTWRQERRRSDEIRYWRASICPSPFKDITPEPTAQDHTNEQTMHEPHHDTTPAQTIEDHIQGATTTPDEEPPFDSRATFDFGGFATEINSQEDITLEARVMTMEVKLMDLEYAISKLQLPHAQTTTNGLGLPSSPPSHAGTGTGPPTTHESISTSQRSHFHSDTATTHSISTQLTSASLANPLDDPFHISHNLSPSSTKSPLIAERIRARTVSPSPTRASLHQRNSLNALTIDHLNSLLGLIRREQAARHRLEDQIVELQREIKTLRQQILPSLVGSPYAPSQSWSPNLGHGHGVGLGQRGLLAANFDDTETDDGFDGPEQFVKPLEERIRGGRAVFEGTGYAVAEGTAF